MRIKANVAAAIIGLCVSSGWAADAYEVAGWAPAEAVAVMAWAGAEQASQGFPESRLGQLWAEPTIQRFLKEPASSGWAWLYDAIAEESTPERATAIQGLLSQLWHQPVMVCAFPVEKSDAWPLSVGFAVLGGADPQSEARAKTLLEWIAEEEKKELPRRTIGGMEFTQLGEDAPVLVARLQDRWLLAFGDQSAAVMAKRWPAPSGYATNPVNLRAQKEIGPVKPFYYSCFDAQAVWTMIKNEITAHRAKTTENRLPSAGALPTGIVAALLVLGGGSFGSQEFATTIAFDGPHLHRISYARSDDKNPLPFDFLGSRPLNTSWLREIPGDVTHLRLGTWEPRKVYAQAIRLAEEIQLVLEPNSQASRPADAGFARRIRDTLGFDPEQDLLPHVGRQAAFYAHPSPGIPSVVLVLELHDGEILNERIEKLLEKLPEQIHFQEIEIGDHRLHVLMFTGNAGLTLNALVSPCWAITGDRLIVASQQSGAIRYLQSRAETQPAVPPAADKAALRDFLASYNGPELASIQYTNEREALTAFYYQMGMFYPVVALGLRESAPRMRLAELPPLTALQKHLDESVGWSTVEGNVRIDHERGGVPALTGGLSLAKLALGGSILLPSLAKARELSKRSVCAANLKEIGAAIHTYASTNESRFPPDFKTLVAAQFLVPKQFRCPGSSAGPPADDPTEEELGACYIYIAGQNADSNPENVLVYEKNVNHKCEGGHVLFVDGHVEFLPVDQVKERVEKTRERLDNPIQKPPLPRKRPGRAGSMPAGR